MLNNSRKEYIIIPSVNILLSRPISMLLVFLLAVAAYTAIGMCFAELFSIRIPNIMVEKLTHYPDDNMLYCSAYTDGGEEKIKSFVKEISQLDDIEKIAYIDQAILGLDTGNYHYAYFSNEAYSDYSYLTVNGEKPNLSVLPSGRYPLYAGSLYKSTYSIGDVFTFINYDGDEYELVGWLDDNTSFIVNPIKNPAEWCKKSELLLYGGFPQDKLMLEFYILINNTEEIGGRIKEIASKYDVFCYLNNVKKERLDSQKFRADENSIIRVTSMIILVVSIVLIVIITIMAFKNDKAIYASYYASGYSSKGITRLILIRNFICHFLALFPSFAITSMLLRELHGRNSEYSFVILYRGYLKYGSLLMIGLSLFVTLLSMIIPKRIIKRGSVKSFINGD